MAGTGAGMWKLITGLLMVMVVDVLGTLSIAAAGVRDHAWMDKSIWHGVTGTGLDVVVLSSSRVVIIILAISLRCASPASGPARTAQASGVVFQWVFSLSYLLLSAKAVLVAMYGGLDSSSGSALPTYMSSTVLNGPGPSLLFIYLATAVSTVTCALEQVLSRMILRIISCSWTAEVVRGQEGAAEPLFNGLDDLQHEGNGDDDAAGKKGLAPAWQIIKVLVQFATPDWLILCSGFMFGAMAAWTQALIPFYIGRIVDITSKGVFEEGFLALVKNLLWVSGGCAVFSGARGSLFTLEYAFLNRRIRCGLFRSLMEQGRTGDVISRLSADVQSVSDAICLNVNVLSRSALQAAVVLYFMFTESEESWRLSIMTFVLVPAILFICQVYGGFYRQLQVDIQSSLAGANSVAEEMISSMTTVKAHGAESYAKDGYETKLGAVFKLQQRQAFVYMFFMAIQTFLPNTMSALVLFYGGSLISQGKMDPGSLVSFMLYQQSLSAAFQAMGDVFSNLSGAVGAAEKVVELLQRQPEIPPSKGYTPSVFHGEIEMKDIVFSYPSRPHQTVLNGFNLQVRAGEVIAFVGPSGGGKSSIVKLMQRFYVPSLGQVMYDGKDVGEYDPAWLRRQVAMVGQEPVLYARSVYENIIFGLPEGAAPSRQEVEDAAKLANAHNFISELPKAYDTNCGDKGVQMSGGQKQRIAIARALVRKPKVLLLDEATSALDADSEHVVQEALDRVMRGRTVVVIAHRLSTIQDSDRIVVIKSGKVTEAGTHQQLVAQAGAYAMLVRRQMAHAGSGSFSSLQSLAAVDQ